MRSPVGLVRWSLLWALLVTLAGPVPASATSFQQVQDRVTERAGDGASVVVHVVVALCDNVHQRIVPVPPRLGNGQDPASNLYWGAAYGVKTFLTRRAGYRLHRPVEPDPAGVLDRIVLQRSLDRHGRPVQVFVVAEAWDGRRIKDAISRFLDFAAGQDPVAVTIKDATQSTSVRAGGSADLVVYVGHNGLMNFSLSSVPTPPATAPPRSSVVLACASDPYFSAILEKGGSHPLLLTTGLMAPEAYTLEAVIRAFVAGDPPSEVRQAAAEAYDTYQHCGIKAASRLFKTR